MPLSNTPRLLVAAALVGSLSTAALPTQANPDVTSVAGPAERHCVVELAADGHGRVGPARCYDDPRAALTAATDRIAPAAIAADPAAAHEWIETSNTSRRSTTVVLSREYDGTAFGGSSLTYTTSNANGCNGTSYSDSQLDSWNNRIGSVRAFAGCRVAHYDGFNFGGASVACSSSCSSLGSMNNRTSSIRHT